MSPASSGPPLNRRSAAWRTQIPALLARAGPASDVGAKSGKPGPTLPRRPRREDGGRLRIRTFERYRKTRLLSGCPVPEPIAAIDRAGGVHSLRLPKGLVDRFSPFKKLGPDLASGSIKAKNNAVFSNAESIVSNQRLFQCTHAAFLARIKIVKSAANVLSDSRMKCPEGLSDLERNLHAGISFKPT